MDFSGIDIDWSASALLYFAQALYTGAMTRPVMGVMIIVVAMNLLWGLISRWAEGTVDTPLNIGGRDTHYGQNGAGGAQGADYWDEMYDTPAVHTEAAGEATWQAKMHRSDAADGGPTLEGNDDAEFEFDDDDDEDE